MNLKRFLGAFLLLLGLAAPAIADDFDNLTMINVIQTDEDDLTWKLMEIDPLQDDKDLAEAVGNLMAGGRYVESVVPTTDDKNILIVHRPNTRGIKQAFSIVSKYYKDIQKDIKKKFKEGFTVKYLSDKGNGAYIVYEQNASVTKQEFSKKQDPSALNAEGFYVRPYSYYETNFAQNGKGTAVQQTNAPSVMSVEKLMRDIQAHKEQGWILSAVATSWYNDSYIAWYDKSDQAPRQTTLVFSSKDELEELISSGVTNRLLVTAQWRTMTTKQRQTKDERKAELESSGGWADALSNFGKAFASGAQMVGQIKGIGSSSSAATTVGTAAADAAASGSSTTKKKKDTTTAADKKRATNFEAYRNYDRAYDGYETQLIKMRSDKKYNIAEVRDIQKKMREIRAKIKELGWTRAVSDVETWNPGED